MWMERAKVRGRDLTGQRFGKLVAVQPEGTSSNGYALWRCRCDCGGEVLAESRRLKSGAVCDCGCVPRARARRDLRGQRFGSLLVLSETDARSKDGDVVWRCRCDCGREVDVSSRLLLRGTAQDCGCAYALASEWVGRRFGLLTVTAFAGVKDSRRMWRCRCDCGNVVEVREANLKNGHSASCGCRVDPLSGCHFVAGTYVEEIRSKTMFSTNTSGVRGVYLDKRSNKWVARIGFQGKTYYLGAFSKLEDAAKARARGEELYEEFLNWYDSESGAELYEEFLESKTMQ